MSDENLFEELAETRRKMWQAAGGTVEGLFEYCHRYAQEDHARFLAEMEREKAAGTWSPDADGVTECAEAMCVHESAPKYEAGKKDFTRQGAEGE